jgi:predicted O-linked N-acetylglucosamine transferase (SPINDLY family)
MAEAARRWSSAHGDPLEAAWPRHARPKPGSRRPRIGLVSGDFRAHAVGFLVLPAIEGLRAAGWHLTLYSNSGKVDAVTRRFEAAASLWRPVYGLSDAALAERIAADGIDILIDLAGYTGQNRLTVFAGKPAPLQVAWAGYPATTGLAAMDYILADRHQLPPEAEPFYREKAVRLPAAYVVFEPPAEAPDPGRLPAATGRGITFGSFNTLKKITPQVVETWSRCLHRLPAARLLMKAPSLNDAATRRRYAGLFAEQGIDPRRLVFRGGTTPAEHVAAMAAADIALDPFPYSGGMTTLECLWMGLPVVTLPGETFASRHTLGYLSAIGLTELVASDADHYVALGVALANDLPRLADLRAGMRRRLRASPLCDRDAFVRHLGAAFDAMWQTWCDGRPAHPITIPAAP